MAPDPRVSGRGFRGLPVVRARLVFGVAGAIGLFVSNQNSIRIAVLIGIALGFLVAPYEAFQRMRWERDVARADSTFDRLASQLGYVNALSGGGWAIDSFQAPNIAGLGRPRLWGKETRFRPGQPCW